MDRGTFSGVGAYGHGVDFRVLGPVAAFDGDRQLPLGGPKQRTVLALVVAGAGRPVSADGLITGVYGDDASGGARRTIHTYVSNLRRELGDVIVPSGQGYVLGVDPLSIDAVRFEKLYRDGSAVLEEAPEQAATLLRDALGLWRGHAYADVEAHTVLEAESVRLDELRLAALEARIGADLALGLHRDVIGELEALVAEYPLREGLRERQMVALYRSGRQSEALRAFTRTREFLGEELGIDPSRELQALEQLILTQDASLDLQVRAVIERCAVLAAELDEGLRFVPAAELDAALARRNQTLEAKAAAVGGSVLDVRGTAVYAQFPSVGAAVEAARVLVDPLVQIAIDFGDIEMGEDGASGPPVTRSLRLAAVGHPGQVLVAEDAHAELATEGSGGWSVAALGLQRIRGLDRPVQVFQLAGEGLAADFPPLRLDRLPPPLPGFSPGAIAGYELRAEMGGGVTGTVHRAYQPTVGREVAARVIRPELVDDPRFVRRFESEAQRIAAIDHPHVVPLLDYWRESEGAFLVHRLMRGGTVRRQIQAGPVSPAETLTLLEQIGAAVAAGHDRGVAHGRIRPANVFVDDDGYAYVADMGLGAMFEGMVSGPADAYTAPETIGGAPTESGDVYSLGVLTAVLLAGAEVPRDGGLPMSGSPADAVIARATHPLSGRRHSSVREFLDELAVALGSPDRVVASDRRSDARNPYKGLGAFREADAADFFGRSDLVDALVAAVESRAFTLVAGPSGVGKSSVVRAGLVPRLRSDDDPGGWLVTDMLPGARPFDQLENALARVAVNPIGHSVEAVRSGSRTLGDTVADLLPKSARLLLVIDQFEELFTHNSDEETRRRFLESITEVATAPVSGLHVVATMRADFLDKPLGYAEFGRLLTSSTVMVPALTRVDLAEVVRRPAANVGVSMDDALVEVLSADADAEPGALPLLQHTLTEMFHERPADELTIGEYRARGGLAGAVRRRAEAIYTELDPTDQATAREVFLRLVNVSPDADDTRRRVKRSELDHLAVRADSATRVIEAFGRHRLLVFDHDPTTRGPTVEVAHEALFTQWDRLAGWIDDARQDLLTGRRLEAAAVEWERSGRDAGYLLTGPRLDQAATWRAHSAVTPSPTVAEFVQAAVERDEEMAATRRTRRRAVLGGFAAAAIVALVLAAVALRESGRANELADQEASARDEAETQAALAEEQAALAEEQAALAEAAARQAQLATIVSRSAALTSENPEVAILLALEAHRRNPNPETVHAVLNALGSGAIPNRIASLGALNDATDACTVQTISADGLTEFGMVAGVMVTRDTTTGAITEHGEAPWCGRWIGDEQGNRRLTISNDGTQMRLGPFDGPWEVEREFDREMILDSRSFTESNRLLFVSFPEGVASVDMIDATTLEQVIPTLQDGNEIVTVESNRDGSLVVLGWARFRGAAGDGYTVVIDGAVGEQLFSVDSGAPASRVTFDDAAGHLIVALFDGTFLTVDIATQQVIAEVEYPTTSRLHDLGIRPDGLLVAVSESEIRLVDRFTGPTGTIVEIDNAADAVVRADGTVLLLSPDNEVDVIDLAGNGLIERTRPVEPLANIAIGAGRAAETDFTGQVPPQLIELSTGARTDVALFRADGTPYRPFVVWPLGDALWAMGLDPNTSSLDDPFVLTRWQDGRMVERIDPGLATPDAFRSGDALAIVGLDAARTRLAALVSLEPGRAGLRFTVPAPDVRTALPAADGGLHVLEIEDDRVVTVRTYDDAGVLVDEIAALPDKPQGSRVGTMAVAPQTGDIAIATSLGVLIIDADTDQVETLPDLANASQLSFVRDGELLVAVDGDGTIRLWNLVGGTSAGLVWDGKGGSRVEAPWYDESSQSLWVASSGRLLQVPLDPARWVERACEVVGRDLTPDEWDRYIPGGGEVRSACGRD